MTALAVLLPVVFVLVLVALVLSWRTKVFHIQVSKHSKILDLQFYLIFTVVPRRLYFPALQ